MGAHEVESARVNLGKPIRTPVRLGNLERCSAQDASYGSSATGKRAPYRGVSPRPRTTIPARDYGDENPAMLVAGWEPDDSRWPVIEDVCKECGARSHRLTGSRRFATIVEPPRYVAAIVALHERPESPECCL